MIPTRPALLSLAMCLLVSCIRPGEERPLFDESVGTGAVLGLRMEVDDGLAVVREIEEQRLVLWAEAPSLQLRVHRDDAGPLVLTVLNCMPGAQVRQGDIWLPARAHQAPTECIFDLTLDRGDNLLQVAPRDAEDLAPFRFAVMGDIQTALPTVDEVFAEISEVDDLRFVVCTGDIVQDGSEREYQLYQDKLRTLRIPIFTTVGNHEVRKPPKRWNQLFGLFTVHFQFKGVDFSLLDSGNASIDPTNYDRLETWLDEGIDRVHIFATHFPPLDPVGSRNASFRSRSEAAKLMTRLAEGQVDLMLFGHIHSFYEYEIAGIPAYISGGGGASPEQYDGVGRHFLAVRVDPANGLQDVAFVAVDE